MRRPRRRRPAGLAQVPLPGSRQVTTPARPRAVVLGFGPGRTLRDPRRTAPGTVAHVWYDTTQRRRLVRVEWPIDPSKGVAIAPLDLSIGHVLEFSVDPCVRDAPPVYAAVVRVASDEVVVIEFEDVDTAVQAAVHVVELWRRGRVSARVTSNVHAYQ